MLNVFVYSFCIQLVNTHTLTHPLCYLIGTVCVKLAQFSVQVASQLTLAAIHTYVHTGLIYKHLSLTKNGLHIISLFFFYFSGCSSQATRKASTTLNTSWKRYLDILSLCVIVLVMAWSLSSLSSLT